MIRLIYQLQVPQHYSLLGYERHDTQEASVNYVRPKLARNLRSGADVSAVLLYSKSQKKLIP